MSTTSIPVKRTGEALLTSRSSGATVMVERTRFSASDFKPNRTAHPSYDLRWLPVLEQGLFGRRLFQAILREFDSDAELCVVFDKQRPIAGALLVHGGEVTEIPSASALNSYRSTNVNMLMYWHLLERAVTRKSRIFDFGRSTHDSNTFQFKKQWGAEPHPSTWQYHIRRGSTESMRPDHAGNRRMIKIWKRLPIWFTRLIGPPIVRGIP